MDDEWERTKKVCRDGELTVLSLAFSAHHTVLLQCLEHWHCFANRITDFDFPITYFLYPSNICCPFEIIRHLLADFPLALFS